MGRGNTRPDSAERRYGMAEKRFYWLKFRSDFFDSKRIKKLRNMAGGDTYCIIYLKMQLKALKTDGVLEFTGIEDQFADELALDIDERPDDVRVTLMFLLQYGMCECSDNIHYFLPYVIENTGSEGESTERVRQYRERQKSLHCNTPVTEGKRIGNGTVTACNTEIEEREEQEVEKSKSIEKERFDAFWGQYPKKQNKVGSEKAFRALKASDELFNEIMDGLARWKASEQWQNPKYIPVASKFIHERRWEDEDIPQAGETNRSKNAALRYEQKPISKADFDAMVVNFDDESV